MKITPALHAIRMALHPERSNMKLKALILTIAILFSAVIFAQDGSTIEGTISFVTSSNVYVRFNSTEGFEIGDKLRISGNECLLVTDKSSSSVVCTIINNCAVQKGDAVTFTFRKPKKSEPEEMIIEEEMLPPTQTEPTVPVKESLYKENIRGRITAASYNTFSDVRGDRHRFRTRLSLNADHIGDSKFSVESFVTYRNLSAYGNADDNPRTNIFNVYNLNVRYDALPDLSFTAGRSINPKTSSLGAIDGLQLEKYFGDFYVGAIGGFRPDFENYGFNSDLLQYGGYVGVETDAEDFWSQTTLGAIEQTNAGATDRRYIYFQHFSTIASNLSLFGSMELDIFGNSGANTRLTNMYLSARYRFSRAANLMVSYDSRKQVIYYETFQTEIERILDDDLARQGLRFRLNVRPAKIVWAGISYSMRSQSNSENESNNINGYITLTKLPYIGGRINISYNINTSDYLTSNILSARHSRELVKNKLNADIYYRLAQYAYESDYNDFDQHFYGAILSWRITRTWQLSVSGELSQFESENTYRFYTRLSKRF